MKKITLLMVLLFILFSCKKEVSEKRTQEKYPKEFLKTLQKHGGINTWNTFKTLSFNKGKEIHTVDLHSRKTAIHTPSYSLGFDGTEKWQVEKEKKSFKGNKDFYYNLYFYFYAMPFVLADDGIIYEETSPLLFEGIKYPGYKISFEANVGSSPDDNYFIYFNPTTYQMEWLGYTVTFYTKQKTNTVKLIRYNLWETTSGFLLPKEITWYQKNKNGHPTIPAKDPVIFELPLISKSELPDSFYEKPIE